MPIYAPTYRGRQSTVLPINKLQNPDGSIPVTNFWWINIHLASIWVSSNQKTGVNWPKSISIKWALPCGYLDQLESWYHIYNYIYNSKPYSTRYNCDIENMGRSWLGSCCLCAITGYPPAIPAARAGGLCCRCALPARPRTGMVTNLAA